MGKIIDVESRPDLLHLVEELERVPEEHLLRWRGQVVAVVRPASPSEGDVADTDDADAAFRAAAGSWHDHIDVDEFVEETYRQRFVSTRPTVDL
jgi:hypothetical protein